MFYLPFEHGRRGLQILKEFSWLHENSYVVRKKPPQADSATEDEVSVKFLKFLSVVKDVFHTCFRFYERVDFFCFILKGFKILFIFNGICVFWP